MEDTNSQRKSLPFAKSFDTLYTNLRLSGTAQSTRSLAVCSAESQDGKSTVAIHLAQAAALTGKRVLLVDADLYHPQLHETFKLPNQKGLSELLTNPDFSIRSVIHQSPQISNLYVLTAGTALSPRLLASEQLSSVMEKLSASFDLVIYDTPYLADHTNTNLLAAQTDGVAFVVNSQKNKRSVVQSILQKTKDLHVPVLGVIVNQVPKRKQAALNLENFAHVNAEKDIQPDTVLENVEVYPQASK